MIGKHTPAPWVIAPHSMNASAQTEIVSGPHGTRRIATLAICESEHANAKLIAAAPALADALESVLGLVSAAQREGSTLADNALAVLRAAGRMLP